MSQYFRVSNLTNSKNETSSKEPSSIKNAVFSQRKQFCGNFLFALFFVGALCGIAGFIAGLVGWNRGLDVSDQRVYGTSHNMFSDRLNHVLRGASAIQLTLPNDLSPYLGRHYTVDCDSAPAHSVVLSPGSLPTFWDGVAKRTATCTGGQGSGFSFRVVSSSRVRITEISGVTLSA